MGTAFGLDASFDALDASFDALGAAADSATRPAAAASPQAWDYRLTRRTGL